jgi:two-component system, NarL family, invasion response regulator UvrY
MKVLIVDDHPIVHAGLRRLIAVEPEPQIREAATAMEALASFKEDRPDLVIMDLNLPGSGGLEMIRRLRIEDASSSSACMTTRFMSPAPSRQAHSAM